MKQIGYWRKRIDSKENLPWPEEGHLPNETKQKVSEYLNNGKEHAAYMGCSTCRICGKWGNGSTDLTDGEFIWPEGYSHYITEHNIMPDLDLLSKVLTQKRYL